MARLAALTPVEAEQNASRSQPALCLIVDAQRIRAKDFRSRGKVSVAACAFGFVVFVQRCHVLGAVLVIPVIQCKPVCSSFAF